jgi:hypothetical protein
MPERRPVARVWRFKAVRLYFDAVQSSPKVVRTGHIGDARPVPVRRRPRCVWNDGGGQEPNYAPENQIGMKGTLQ